MTERRGEEPGSGRSMPVFKSVTRIILLSVTLIKALKHSYLETKCFSIHNERMNYCSEI